MRTDEAVRRGLALFALIATLAGSAGIAAAADPRETMQQTIDQVLAADDVAARARSRLEALQR